MRQIIIEVSDVGALSVATTGLSRLEELGMLVATLFLEARTHFDKIEPPIESEDKAVGGQDD